MSKYKTDVVYKISREAKGKDPEMGNIYFKNVPVVFAQVLKAGKKYQSEDTAYQLQLFINPDTMTKVEEIGLNKEMAEVGVTKIKKGANRGKLKFELNEHYTDYQGMFGAQFSRDTVKRDKEGVVVKEYKPLKVIDVEGEPFTEELGNGTICNVKMYGYRNDEGMLVVKLDTVVVLEHVPYVVQDSFDEELGVKPKTVDPDLQASSDEDDDDIF